MDTGLIATSYIVHLFRASYPIDSIQLRHKNMPHSPQAAFGSGKWLYAAYVGGEDRQVTLKGKGPLGA